MTATRTVELEGHIIDSGMMQRCFGIVMDMGGNFEIEEFTVGRHKDEESYCRMRVIADDEATLTSIVHDDETGDVFRVAVRNGQIEFHVLPATEAPGLRALYDRLVAADDRSWQVDCRIASE